MSMHRIYLHDVPARDDAPAVQGGWLGGPGDTDDVFRRTRNREEAQEFTRELTIYTVMKLRGLGFDCHAEPEITLSI